MNFSPCSKSARILFKLFSRSFFDKVYRGAMFNKNSSRKDLELLFNEICFSFLFQFGFARNTQLFATFFSSVRQYCTSVSGFHAFAESVYRFSASAMRLECTFHNIFFFLFLKQWIGRSDQVCSISPRVTTPVEL